MKIMTKSFPVVVWLLHPIFVLTVEVKMTRKKAYDLNELMNLLSHSRKHFS